MKSIIDTGAVMNTTHLPDFLGKIYTTSQVIEEVKSQMANQLLQLLKAKYDIIVTQPKKSTVDHINVIAKEMGQINLSATDLSVLALGYDFHQLGDKVIIYSDDYSVRNVAHQLEIESSGVTTKGGNEKREYNFKCEACGEIYAYSLPECDICGHKSFVRFRRS